MRRKSKTAPADKIYSLAHQVAAGELREAPNDLAQAVRAARIKRIPAAIWTELAARLNSSPREGYALARVLIAVTNTDSAQCAKAQLFVMRALNYLGEFRDAINAAQETARAFSELGDAAHAARTWLEAALAETYLGNLETTREYVLRSMTPPLEGIAVLARVKWMEGRIARERGDYAQAVQRFEQARALLQSEGETLDAARLGRELGHTYIRIDPATARPVLEEARRRFKQAKCAIEIAQCDYFLAQSYLHSNDFKQAQARLITARKTFSKQGARFFEAWCDLEEGFVQWRLNDFEKGLQLFQQARDYFLKCGATAEASSCDVNIGGVLLELNRYDEALEILERTAQAASASGRRKKAAICFVSMAYAFDKQGRYAQALEQYRRARDEFAKEEMLERVVTCDLYLGLNYFNLGEYQEALKSLEQARTISVSQHFDANLAECELYRAQVLLVTGRRDEARRALRDARALFVKTGQEVYVAYCDRLLASAEPDDRALALKRLETSRALFIQRGQPVDAALCDLTRAELRLVWEQWNEARADFQKARKVLLPGFPDNAWRADYGLGQVALAQTRRGVKSGARPRKDGQARAGTRGDPKRVALPHFLDAVASIAKVRAGLGLEQLSNNLFGARQHVFGDAIEFARDTGEFTKALGVVETAKARTFLENLIQRDWRIRPAPGDKTDWVGLSQRERELRYELAALRARVSVQAGQLQGEALRADTAEEISTRTLKELDARYADYESVVTRLRLAGRGLTGVPTLAPFSLEALREMARARWGDRWLALDYYFSGSTLTTVCVDSEKVEVESAQLSDYEKYVLEQCTSVHPNVREVMYRGTLQGDRAPSLGAKYLHTLAAKLIPARVRAAAVWNSQANSPRTLIIAPHGVLHRLPFHALMDAGHHLLERFTFVYTPSLEALTQLHQGEVSGLTRSNMLLAGLDDFGSRARPLQHTLEELDALKRTSNGSATTLYQSQATRRTLLEWSASGALAQFGIIHLATHAIAEPRAPHWSRIFLSDDDLTVLDVMDLNLSARLVTLSGCSSAQGEGGAGDELVGLARAFFYAGARALVASLWAVEDESTPHLMEYFYASLKTGLAPAGALREAQLKMLRAGWSPFQWAPFVAIGAA